MILITGANGFLGRHIVNSLNDRVLSLLVRGSANQHSKHKIFTNEINETLSYNVSHIDTVQLRLDKILKEEGA